MYRTSIDAAFLRKCNVVKNHNQEMPDLNVLYKINFMMQWKLLLTRLEYLEDLALFEWKQLHYGNHIFC